MSGGRLMILMAEDERDGADFRPGFWVCHPAAVRSLAAGWPVCAFGVGHPAAASALAAGLAARFSQVGAFMYL